MIQSIVKQMETLDQTPTSLRILLFWPFDEERRCR